MSHRIPPSVQHQLGFYVYLYVDPRDDSVFYIGKGKGGRALSHFKDRSESEKVERIAELTKKNKYRHCVLAGREKLSSSW